MKIFGLVFILFFVSNFPVSGQGGFQKFVDYMDNGRFYSLQAFVTGNKLSYPAIELNSGQTLTLSFDELGTQANDFYYQIIHCNADWNTSDMFSDEFMTGFNENSIGNYNFSVNTTVNYVNYQVTLPNDEVQFKISGNYIFRVIEANNRDSSLLTKRFVVYEPIVGIDARVIRTLSADLRDNSQEVELKIQTNELEITDPFTEIKVFVSQNNCPDKVINDIKPVFVRNDELVYNLPGQLVFQGGNEFRMFSFTNINRMGINVNDVHYSDSCYHVQLRLDEKRSYKKYFWEEEFNGRFFINLLNSDDSYRSSDYGWVYFTLPLEKPFFDAAIYIVGGFSLWQPLPENKMEYQFDRQQYEARLFLKQGYYNYLYQWVDAFTGMADNVVFEGSHYQTENDYVIYVYHHHFTEKYDRLVGYRVINSKYQ